MDWWHKLRKTFTVLSTRIKLRKSADRVVGGCRSSRVVELGRECGGAVGGLLNLRHDVEMCGYRDVEVMWNMLSLSLTPEPMENAISAKPKFSRRKFKPKFNPKLIFWTNHNT